MSCSAHYVLEQFAPPKSTSTVPLPRLIKAEISPRTAEASGQQDDVCHKGKLGGINL